MKFISNENSRLFRLCCGLVRVIPDGTVFPVFKGPLRGAKWIAGAAAGNGKGLSVLINHSEPEQLRVARELMPTKGVCFDIGANVGLYTLLFALHSKRVFAFEPLPRNVGLLYRLICLNKLNNVEILPCAVSDATGLASFSEGSNCATGRLKKAGRLPVVTVTCDDVIQNFDVVPSLLKIDVEGAEMQVLNGARKLLSSETKPVILLSTHGESNRFACLSFLKDVGYSRFVPIDTARIEAATEIAILPASAQP